MAQPSTERFYRATRRLRPRAYRARVATVAGGAAAAQIIGLGAAFALLDAPSALWAALAPAAALSAAGVWAVWALLAPVERLGAALRGFAEGRVGAPTADDAPTTIARGVEALSKRLDAAMRRVDPTRLEDPLTGLPNRLAAMRRGRDEIIRARRAGQPLSVAMLAFRDPGAGDGPETAARRDLALRLAAEALTQSLRAYDVVSRWEGLRFVALMPEAEIEHAVSAVRRARGDARMLLSAQGFDEAFDLAAGLAVLQPDDATLADMAARAGLALERALSGAGDGVQAAPGPRTRPAHLTSV